MLLNETGYTHIKNTSFARSVSTDNTSRRGVLLCGDTLTMNMCNTILKTVDFVTGCKGG